MENVTCDYLYMSVGETPLIVFVHLIVCRAPDAGGVWWNQGFCVCGRHPGSAAADFVTGRDRWGGYLAPLSFEIGHVSHPGGHYMDLQGLDYMRGYQDSSLSNGRYLTVFMKTIRHIGHFRWLVPNVSWEISQIWIEYIKPIGQISDESWKFFGYTCWHALIPQAVRGCYNVIKQGRFSSLHQPMRDGVTL